NNYSPEIFHIVGPNSLSPFAAAKLIAKTFDLNEILIFPTTFQEYSLGKAKRSQYSEIKSKKNNFYKMRGLEEGLREIKKQI
ncbi:sugar nucleotide-binding protein, partial [Candidatus Roizmanbacteria bacterium]|nr:sugar nucleotide-binding protein [Candidatus Roizmanbacteria bacterium]